MHVLKSDTNFDKFVQAIQSKTNTKNAVTKLVDDGDEKREITVTVVQEQREFYWLRITCADILEVKQGEKIMVKHRESGEKVIGAFSSYHKVISGNKTKDGEHEIVHTGETDKYTLCAMFDIKDLEQVPTICSYFPGTPAYSPQLYRTLDFYIEVGDVPLEFVALTF